MSISRLGARGPVPADRLREGRGADGGPDAADRARLPGGHSGPEDTPPPATRAAFRPGRYSRPSDGTWLRALLARPFRNVRNLILELGGSTRAGSRLRGVKFPPGKPPRPESSRPGCPHHSNSCAEHPSCTGFTIISTTYVSTIHKTISDTCSYFVCFKLNSGV